MDLPEPLHTIRQPIKKLVRALNHPLSVIALILLLTGTSLLIHPTESKNLRASISQPAEDVAIGSFPIVEPTLRYGFALDTFQLEEGRIKSGDFLGNLLSKHGVDYAAIDQLARNAKGIFPVEDLRYGKPYLILSRDSLAGPDYFIYEPSVYEYVVFNLKKELSVERVKRPVTNILQSASGTVQGSLWESMVSNGLGQEVASKMEDALQWSIDFHRLQKGDKFKLVYDQDFVEGAPVGVGRVHAAYYQTGKNEYYAIYYTAEEHRGYYDREGRPMNKGFLKAPVKASRISSYYNLARFHPILKRVRPHFGTDYAAPYGTEILAVGDGVVLEASYTGGNGNYVKIRHNKTYTTQYLHMQRFAKGIRSGAHVQQGQVIGYVGSTGLATGPHVCFRFWKNNQQVNHLNLNFPPPDPLPASEMPEFITVRDSLLHLLDRPGSNTPAGQLTEESSPRAASAISAKKP